MYVCIYASAGHMSVGVFRGQEKMSESLELDAWVFVSILGTKLWPSGRAASTPNH